jgi:zinc transport system permease protein
MNMNMDDFLINALLAGIGLALVAGPLGCVVVWRRMAYFGDTLAHSALLGIALAVSADVMPVPAVAVTGMVIATVLFWLEKNRELSTDTLLGILSHTALALGLIVVSIEQTRGASINLMGYLFGDILAVSDSELIWIYAGALLVLTLFSYIWRALLSISVHEELAQTDGVAILRTRFIFMLMLALTIAVAIKIVGILLITALLIIPAATARLFSRTPLSMVVLSVVFAIASVLFGLGGSLYWDVSTGPAIVVASSAAFFISRLLRFQ